MNNLNNVQTYPKLVSKLTSLMHSELKLKANTHYTGEVQWRYSSNGNPAYWEIKIKMLGRHFRKAAQVKDKLNQHFINAKIIVI